MAEETGRIERRVGYPTSGTGTGSTGDAPGVGGGSLTPNAYNQMITDASSFSLTLDSGNRNAIQWIAAKTHVLIGTTGGEWRLSGHSNKPFTPTNYDLKQQTFHGSKDMQSIRITDAVAFVNTVGRKLYKLQYNGVSENYDAPDLSILAEHITKTGITTMAFQRNPDDILWATLADGNLISMTYDPEQNVIAWALHPMPTGDETPLLSEGTPEVPAVPANYEGVYISENEGIYYIPLGDGGLQSSIDAGSSAVDYGDGTVGLPYTNNPFTVGQTVAIETTTNYDGNHTVLAGTTTSELRIIDTYVAEVFDGTETVVRLVATAMPSGAARMAQDSSGNLYYAHQAWGTVPNVYYVTRVATDGTESPSTNWLTFEFNDGSSCRGVAITPDDAFIYIWLSSLDIYKFNLQTGVLVWQSEQPDGTHGYNIALDADGNAYTARANTNNNPAIDTNKFDAADGSWSRVSNNKGTYDVIVDDDMSVVISVGWQIGVAVANLWVTSLDGLENDSMLVGGANGSSTWKIGTGQVTTFGGFIYIISGTPTPTLYKIAWDGSSLSLAAIVPGPTRGIGIYFDIYDNLVVVNQSFASGTTEVFHYYDADLNALSSIDNFEITFLRSWNATAGGIWIQGNVYPDGHLGIPAVPAIPGTAIEDLNLGANSVAVIPGDGEDEVWVSVGRVVDGGLVRFIERMKPRDWGDDMEDMFFVDSGLTYDSTATTSLTGLDHLEGETVAILGDGAVMPTAVVSGGSVTLAESVSVAQVGLPYTFKLKPMRMDQNTRQGTSKGSIAKFAEVVISFYKTLNAKFGDGNTTFKEPWRESSDAYGDPPALFTGDKDVNADGGFSVEDPFQIEGDDPMPCSVRAIIPRKAVTGR